LYLFCLKGLKTMSERTVAPNEMDQRDQ